MKFGEQTHYGGNLLMVLASVAAVATASGAIWGLQKADSGLANIESATQDVATDLLAVSREGVACSEAFGWGGRCFAATSDTHVPGQ